MDPHHRLSTHLMLLPAMRQATEPSQCPPWTGKCLSPCSKEGDSLFALTGCSTSAQQTEPCASKHACLSFCLLDISSIPPGSGSEWVRNVFEPSSRRSPSANLQDAVQAGNHLLL